MAEWDQLEARLKDLGASAADVVDDPLDPAIVRQRGVQRRHRRWATSVAATVVVMVCGGAGVYAFTAQHQPPAPAGLPTWSPSSEYVEPSMQPSARGRLLPSTSSRKEHEHSGPLPYATARPSSPEPGSMSPTPSPTATPTPSDSSEPTESPTTAPTETSAPPPSHEPSADAPSHPAQPVPLGEASGHS